MKSGEITWLPSEIDISLGTFTEIIQILYAKFQMDIKCGKIIVYGLRVGYAPGYEPSGLGYEKIFWHLITRDDPSTGDRLIDYKRAPKLSWIKPILEHCSESCIKIWDYQEGTSKKGTRTYVWLEQYDFLVILQKCNLRSGKTVMNIITSFHIDGPIYCKKLYKKWENRIK